MQYLLPQNNETHLKSVIKLTESIFKIAKRTHDKSQLKVLSKIIGPVTNMLYAYNHVFQVDLWLMLGEYVQMKLEGTRGWIKEYENDIDEEIKRAVALYHPEPTRKEKDIIDKKTLPIMSKMVHNPEDSPKLFTDLANTLYSLIKEGLIAPTTAAKELHFATDRPQIMYAKQLRTALKIADEMDLPGEFKTVDMEEMWDRLVKSLPVNRKS